MIDYSKGKIYTIRNKNEKNWIYVGSTIETLSSRMSKHRYNSEKKPHTKFYSKIQDWNDWFIELYELFPCKTLEELHKREGEIIREIGTLNMLINGRTQKEYRMDTKEKKSLYDKEYRENNSDRINQDFKCDCGGKYKFHHKKTHERTKIHQNYLENSQQTNS